MKIGNAEMSIFPKRLIRTAFILPSLASAAWDLPRKRLRHYPAATGSSRKKSVMSYTKGSSARFSVQHLRPEKSADCEFAWALILRLQRMAGLTGRTAATEEHDERQEWAVLANDPNG